MSEMRRLTPIPPADVMATRHGSRIALFLTNRELAIPSETYIPAILDAEERLYCATTR